MNKLDESITKGKDRAHYINKKNTIIKKSYLYGLSVRDGQPDAARSDHFVSLPPSTADKVTILWNPKKRMLIAYKLHPVIRNKME